MEEEKIKLISMRNAEKLLKMAGAKRVKEDAVKILRELLESELLERAKKVCELAVKFTNHMRRKVVRAEDVEIAIVSTSNLPSEEKAKKVVSILDKIAKR